MPCLRNPNDDLDDQLYILLASMKEYREDIAVDQKRLETFYTLVATRVLDKAEKSLQNTTATKALAYTMMNWVFRRLVALSSS